MCISDLEYWNKVTNTEPESDELALFYFSETDEMEYGCIKNLKNKNTPTFYFIPCTPKEILWKRLEEDVLLNNI